MAYYSILIKNCYPEKNNYIPYDINDPEIYECPNVYLYTDKNETSISSIVSFVISNDIDMYSTICDESNEYLNNSAIYYNLIQDYDKSKKLLLRSNTDISILNYAILYDEEYFNEVYKRDSNNCLFLYHFILYLIRTRNTNNISEYLNKLLSNKNEDIGSFIFTIGFEFQDDLEDYTNADICFNSLCLLDPTKDYNKPWILQGERLINEKNDFLTTN